MQTAGDTQSPPMFTHHEGKQYLFLTISFSFPFWLIPLWEAQTNPLIPVFTITIQFIFDPIDHSHL